MVIHWGSSIYLASLPKVLIKSPILALLIMRYSNIILFCLLATVLYVFFQFPPSSSTTTTSAPVISLPGRRSMRSRSSLSSRHIDPEQNIKKVDADANRSSKADHSMARNNHSDTEPIYNIDYNGVTTHPTPTPKHP